jgi:hypothetical protein
MADDTNTTDQEAVNAKKSAALLRAEATLLKKQQKLMQAELKGKKLDKARRLIEKQDAKKNRSKLMKITSAIMGAGVKGAGGVLGGVPVAGAMVRAMGRAKDRRSAANNRLINDAKQQEIFQAEVDEAKLRVQAAEKKQTEVSPTQKLADAASKLEAAVHSMGPFFDSFETVSDKLYDAGDKMLEAAKAQRVYGSMDESLMALQDIGDESTTILAQTAEKITGIGKDIGNIKWHMARANGSAGRIEKILKDGSKQEAKDDTKLLKDIGNIKWHTARANGTVGRIEKMMIADRALQDQQINILEEESKTQKKQLKIQEETKTIGMFSMIFNLLGGLGNMAKLLGGLGRAGAVVLGATAAWEIGQAIGTKLYEWLSQYKLFNELGMEFGRAVDHILSWFGDEGAKDRLKMWEQDDNQKLIEQENAARANLGVGPMSKEEEDYTMRNGEIPNMIPSTHLLKDGQGITGRTVVFANDIEAERQQMEFDKAMELNKMSADVEDGKSQQAKQGNANIVTSSTVNSTSTKYSSIRYGYDR